MPQKDAGSTADSEIHKPTLHDVQGTGGVTFSKYCDDQPEASLDTSRGMEDAVADTSDSLHVDDHNRQTEAHPCAHGSERDEEMERVLDKQAELIGQFQAEENAQREWEQKYNEKKISTLAEYKLGNCIEHSSQFKKEFSEPADRIPDNDEVATLRAIHTSSNEESTVESLSNADKNERSDDASFVGFSNFSLPQITTADSNGRCLNTAENYLRVQQCDGMAAKETKTIAQEFRASATQCCDMIRNGKQNEVMQVSNGYPSNSRWHQHGSRTSEDISSQTGFPIDNHSKLPKLGPQQKNQLQLQQQLPQAPSSSLGGVLEALQRAKLSLNQGLKKMPSPSQGTFTLTSQTNAHNSSVDGLDIHIGSANLFRLPSDTFPRAHFFGPKYYGSVSLPANRPDVGFATNSHGYQNPSATSYVEGGSRFVPGREYFDNYFGSSMGAPDSNRYSWAFSDLPAGKASFRSEFSKSYSDVKNGNYRMLPRDKYGLYGADQTRSDVQML